MSHYHLITFDFISMFWKHICNDYSEIFFSSIHHLCSSKSTSIMSFLPRVYYTYLFHCISHYYYYWKLGSFDMIYNKSEYRLLGLLFILSIVYLFSEWLNYISEVYSLSQHNVKPLMILFKGCFHGYSTVTFRWQQLFRVFLAHLVA